MLNPRPFIVMFLVYALLCSLSFSGPLHAAHSPPDEGAKEEASESEKPLLEPPVRLKAGDEYINTGEYIAHSGPSFFDYDNDGKTDLLVGCIRGHILTFKNKGEAKDPEYEYKGLLEAEGEAVKINNW